MIMQASSSPDLWPPALDALAASPDQHTLLYENDKVRVLETRIQPGERTPVHTHQWAGVLYITSWSHFLRRDADGNVLVDSRNGEPVTALPAAIWGPALPPHSFENVGDKEFRLVAVELKE